MRNLYTIVNDMRALAGMLADLSNDIAEIGKIFAPGGDFPPVKEDAKPLPFVPDGGDSPPKHRARKNYARPYPKRNLSKQEKEQIRLLWTQASNPTDHDLMQLAVTYRTSLHHVRTILTNNVSYIKAHPARPGSGKNRALTTQASGSSNSSASPAQP